MMAGHHRCEIGNICGDGMISLDSIEKSSCWATSSWHSLRLWQPCATIEAFCGRSKTRHGRFYGACPQCKPWPPCQESSSSCLTCAVLVLRTRSPLLFCHRRIFHRWLWSATWPCGPMCMSPWWALCWSPMSRSSRQSWRRSIRPRCVAPGQGWSPLAIPTRWLLLFRWSRGQKTASGRSARPCLGSHTSSRSLRRKLPPQGISSSARHCLRCFQSRWSLVRQWKRLSKSATLSPSSPRLSQIFKKL